MQARSKQDQLSLNSMDPRCLQKSCHSSYVKNQVCCIRVSAGSEIHERDLLEYLELGRTHNIILYGTYITYVRTYIHTYRHTDIQTYRHTYLHTYILTYILRYLHTYILTYLNTYLLTYLHTYILTYLHTYILTYLHTYILTY